jgi:NAD(P)-dependent dehydrogenase (short-subunit alcohol dehydrogenase family)
MKQNWNMDDMPDQSGKTVLITGANDGLGYHLTKAFLEKNGKVIMACRNMEKADRVQKEMTRLYPESETDLQHIDLGKLESVKEFAQGVLQDYKHLDIIMCNAGVMAVPYGTTKDGFETHMGVNYYGHFVLIANLMRIIKQSPGIRIVTTSSAAEKIGKLSLDKPVTEQNYNRWRVYGDSKLAMLMFALSLDKRFKKAGIDGSALSAHPGYAKSSLRARRLETEKNIIQRFLLKFFEMLSMSAERGVLPLLYAATDPEAHGGEFVGVSGIFQMHGSPKIVKGQKRAYDESLQEELWSISEKAANVSFDLSK